MSKSDTGSVSLVAGFILIFLSLSALIPAVFVAMDSPTETTITQEEGQTYSISANYHTIATNINNTGTRGVNISIININTGESVTTGPIDEGDNVTVQIDGNDITVNNNDVVNANTVVMLYEHPIYLGWPSGARTFAENSPLMIIISSIFLMLGIVSLATEVK